MDIFTALESRRSCREFAPDPVDPATIERILTAATWAPSPLNTQPWKFIVVRDRAKLDGITSFHPYCTMITQVSVAIIVCGDPSGKKWADLWPQDCSAAVQNFMLYLWKAGVGSKWVTSDITRDSRFFDIAGIDADKEFVVGLIFFGYPKLTPTQSRKPVEDVLTDLP